MQAENLVDTQALQATLERALERIDFLESRANDLERAFRAHDEVLTGLENSLSTWKTKLEGQSAGVSLQIKDLAEALKTNNEGDKAQSGQISGLEAENSKIKRTIDSLDNRIGGGYQGEWPIEQIRDTVRNSAYTIRVLQGVGGLIGVSGVGVLLTSLFGFGQVPEEDLTFLSTHQQLERRFEAFQLEMSQEVAKWEVIYDSLEINIGQAPPQ